MRLELARAARCSLHKKVTSFSRKKMSIALYLEVLFFLACKANSSEEPLRLSSVFAWWMIASSFR